MRVSMRVSITECIYACMYYSVYVVQVHVMSGFFAIHIFEMTLHRREVFVLYVSERLRTHADVVSHMKESTGNVESL